MNIPTVIIVGADKGGVGKTTISRALLDYFKAHGVEFRAFDTEAPGGVLKRFFPDKTEVVDLTRSDGQMKVFDTLGQTKYTVIDVRAGLLTPTLETLRDIGFLDAVKENKLKIVVLHILGSTVASFNEIKSTAAILDGSRHLLVTNHINDTEYFGWDTDVAKEVLGVADGTLDIPKLNELAAEHVESSGRPFGDYTNDTGNSMVIRGYVRHWLTKVFAQFNSVNLDPQ